jgi:carbon starvation protein
MLPFAAIAGAGPLIGTILAAQFGYLPGFLWILIGSALGGAVHDTVILCASVRRDGHSLAQIARDEIEPVGGIAAAFAILFIIIVALAGLGLAGECPVKKPLGYIYHCPHHPYCIL